MTVRARVPSDRYEVHVLAKALDVLLVLAEAGKVSLTDIARMTGANKASVFRIMRTLEHYGFATQDPSSRKYEPGTSLRTLAATLIGTTHIVAIARPSLLELRDEFGETVNLARITEGFLEYLDIVEGSRGLRMSAQRGGRDNLHSTALGKMLLAGLDVDERPRFLRTIHRPVVTDKTITSLRGLETELALTRSRGYAVDNEENEIGARCVAVPLAGLDGRTRVAISISGPLTRMDDEVIQRMQLRLTEAAGEISARMGI